MLFGGMARQGIKDVREVGSALLDGPILHGGSHDVRQRRIELDPLLDGLAQGLVDDPGQAFLHHLVAENVASVDFSRLGVGIVQGGEIRFVAGNGSDGIAAGVASAHASVLLGGIACFDGMVFILQLACERKRRKSPFPRVIVSEKDSTPLYEPSVLRYMKGTHTSLMRFSPHREDCRR